MDYLIFSIKQVFSKPRYIVLSVIAFLFVLTLAIWLPNINFLAHTATSNLFSISEKFGILSSIFGSFGTNFTVFSRIITITLAFLFAINFSFFTYFLLRSSRLNREAGIGTTGFILGLIGVGCASCGSVILTSFLGVSSAAGFIGVMPLKGQEFGLLSIVFLSISIYFISKKIKDPIVCNTKPITLRSLLSIIPVWVKVAVFIFLAFVIGVLATNKFLNGESIAGEALAAKFEKLSQNGNSSCSGDFKNSISSMPDGARLQGSCCSPMDMHRYSEQVEGLKKYKNIKEIPPDPYDIDAKLARNLLSHYEDKLTPQQQKAYDYAMDNSKEKGPCCCKCWRWYVYGGLAKYLIQNYNFTGEQITKVWNLSDGCGGAEDHVNH